MNRDEKVASVAELHERFSRASVALVASNLGLTAAESRALRRTLRAAGGELKVAKHTLGKIAMQETRYAQCGSLLVGPRGLVFGYTDPVAVAKALVDFAEQHAKLQIDGGAVEGQIIPSDGVKALARMPALPALQARIARQALSPGSRIASSVQAPAQRIAGAIEALVTKLEEAGGA
ncbi:50S ribosomal protein L10 [bacterium]|nr:50S ribosomal protein L10 [bacterium]